MPDSRCKVETSFIDHWELKMLEDQTPFHLHVLLWVSAHVLTMGMGAILATLQLHGRGSGGNSMIGFLIIYLRDLC